MGKYLPIIVTAKCGSLTRAAQALGYTQPSLGYIINNLEEEMGAKLFFRNQRGVTLTEVGARLLPIMQQIENLEEDLSKEARVGQEERLRLGIFPSVASLWLPGILVEFYKEHPTAAVQLQHQFHYLDGEVGVKEHTLDCSFFTGQCPAGLESIPLYKDPYYLVVNSDSALAYLAEVSVADVVDQYRFIPTNESFDQESAIWDVYRTFEKVNLVDFQPQENRMAVAMVDAGLGITILPGLDMLDLTGSRRIRAIPLKERLTRTISLLCPRGPEKTPLTQDFLRLTQKQVAQWELEQH